MKPQLFIGLISGTSVDGIDVAITDFSSERPQLVAFDCHPINPDLASDIHALCADETLLPADVKNPNHSIARVDLALGEVYAQAITETLAKAALSAADIVAIGNHGQTVRHQPPQRSAAEQPVRHGFSIQIGSNREIAQRTGIRTIGQFRQADMAAGGEGAPLAPLIHQRLTNHTRAAVGFLNLGGIANLTLLENQQFVCGYDTGPANTLMDGWIREHRGLDYDDEGQWALSGEVVPELLEQLLRDPYFQTPFPKSTGRELFHAEWLREHIAKISIEPKTEDVQATLLELSAVSICNELDKAPVRPGKLYCCGGGYRNNALIMRIKSKLNGIELSDTSGLGVHPDAVEACLFGWLAKLYVDNVKVDLGAITGSHGAVLLGEEAMN